MKRELPILTLGAGQLQAGAGTAACMVALAVALAGCVQPGRAASNPPAVKLARTIELPGVRGTRPDVGIPGRLDHLAYDPATKRLYVAALENGSLEVLDLGAGRRVRSIPGLSRPQGVAVASAAGCVAVACGGDGVMHVYDTRTLDESGAIGIGPDADNVRYDARDNAVYVSYGETNRGAIAVLDARTWSKLRDIRFQSRPESFQLDPTGTHVFANLPESVRSVKDGVVAVANRNDGQIEAQVQLKARARNFPMAFDAAHERLFIASRRPARLMVIDTRRCAVIADAPCTDDSDDLFYDAQTGRVLVIGGGFRPDLQEPGTASPCSPPGEMGALDVFAVGANGELTRLSTTPTAPHARTGLFVPSRRAVYIAVPFHGEREAEIREYRVE
jgi:hypothetical protein